MFKQNLLFLVPAEFPAIDEGRGRGGVGEEKEAGGAEADAKRCGLLKGVKIAVSCLFSSDDQALAASILKEKGGTDKYVWYYAKTHVCSMHTSMHMHVHVHVYT